ncbi:MAG: histidinol dehydrogenase [Bacteroidetes bacterium]|nr:MAG: histidinol dehydrogenase [Bacteroidota bacterium]
MKIIRFPDKKDWQDLLKRPSADVDVLEKKVLQILEEVKTKGDQALKDFSLKFDRVDLDSFLVTEEEWKTAGSFLTDDLKLSIRQAAENIELFHRSQIPAEERVETMPGVICWRKTVGIEKVGLYIPGGSAPLFSTILMLGIPARIAGCREILLCTPPDTKGKIHPAILYAASLAGIHKAFKVGGAQAIAAMAFGTGSVPRVDKIFGPGNQYVTCAKQLIQKSGVAIDMPAGPSEVAIYADDSANPAFVAADLLSQAEHGSDSQVLFVTTSEALLNPVCNLLDEQIEKLSRKGIAAAALKNSHAVLVADEDIAMELLNQYAPEHLILATSDPGKQAAKVINAGSVFLGHFSPESAGDYASGTNHTLPTNGYARSYSGVSVDSFVRKITFQELTRDGLKAISKTVITMAEAEGLSAHAQAVKVRLDQKL